VGRDSDDDGGDDDDDYDDADVCRLNKLDAVS
jgi:hypothetical protein